MKPRAWLLTALLLLAACGTESTPPAASPNDARTAAPTTTTVTTSTVTTTTVAEMAGRRAPDTQAPDGPCDGFEIRPNVMVVVGDVMTMSGCTQVAPSQTLQLANRTRQTIELVWGARRIEVPPTDREHTQAGRAGDLLAPGVHVLGGRQYWLVDEPPMRFPSTPIEMGRFGPIEIGMTVRDVEAILGGTLLVNPRFAGSDGHPIPTEPRAMPPYGYAYFESYDGSIPFLSLRANGSDPLDALVVWITPANGPVPSAVRVGWTEAQVREVYGKALVDPQSLTCALPNQKILVVFDDAPATGTRRLWFVFEDGRLRSVSTSSVTLAETGVMDC